MKIAAVETINLQASGNVLWVRIHTDSGLVGLGETFRNAEAVAAYIHETCTPYLLGKDPLNIEQHADELENRVGSHFSGFPTRSVELRGNSAVDIALWDILGKSLGCPLYQLLGGRTQTSVRAYNTCAGYAYNAPSRAGASTEGVDWTRRTHALDTARPYEDLDAQIHAPEDLVLGLLDQGITAMKVWPFDSFAATSRGSEISLADLKRGVSIIERMRAAGGDRMDILLEMHSCWQLAPATQIAHALRDLDIYWFEDPVSMQNFADIERFAGAVENSRVAGSESMGTAAWYREVFTRGAIDVANFDMGWVGGLTAGRRIAALAHAFDRPIAPHDCTGPVVFTANAHLLSAVPNASLAEVVRAYHFGFYADVATGLPKLEGGHIEPPNAPGLGVELASGIEGRPDATVRISR